MTQSQVSFDNRRKSKRTLLTKPVTAKCWFNRWLKPVIEVQVIDISNHGMKLSSKTQLHLGDATIRQKSVGKAIHGRIVWQKNEEEGTFVFGFMVSEGYEISDEDVEAINFESTKQKEAIAQSK